MQSVKWAILIVGASVAGCGSLHPPRDCKSSKIDPAPYAATRHAFKSEALPRGTRVAVRTYKMTADSARVWPCSQLELKKVVVLQRERAPTLTINEVREVYAEDGTLIVKAVDDVSQQLARSGHYAAVLALPIPQQAPAGKYRIVTKLLLETDAQKPTLLAQTSTAFTVMGSDAAVDHSKPVTRSRARRPANLKNSAP